MSEIIERMEELRGRMVDRRIELASSLGSDQQADAVATLASIHTAIEAIEAAIADVRRKADPQIQAMSS